MVVHTGEKPFECEICNLRFTHKTSLRRHTQKCIMKNLPLQVCGGGVATEGHALPQ